MELRNGGEVIPPPHKLFPLFTSFQINICFSNPGAARRQSVAKKLWLNLASSTFQFFLLKFHFSRLLTQCPQEKADLNSDQSLLTQSRFHYQVFHIQPLFNIQNQAVQLTLLRIFKCFKKLLNTEKTPEIMYPFNFKKRLRLF